MGLELNGAVEVASLQSWVKPLNELKWFCTGCIIKLGARATDDVLIYCCVRKMNKKSSESLSWLIRIFLDGCSVVSNRFKVGSYQSSRLIIFGNHAWRYCYNYNLDKQDLQAASNFSRFQQVCIPVSNSICSVTCI